MVERRGSRAAGEKRTVTSLDSVIGQLRNFSEFFHFVYRRRITAACRHKSRLTSLLASQASKQAQDSRQVALRCNPFARPTQTVKLVCCRARIQLNTLNSMLNSQHSAVSVISRSRPARGAPRARARTLLRRLAIRLSRLRASAAPPGQTPVPSCRTAVLAPPPRRGPGLRGLLSIRHTTAGGAGSRR